MWSDCAHTARITPPVVCCVCTGCGLAQHGAHLGCRHMGLPSFSASPYGHVGLFIHDPCLHTPGVTMFQAASSAGRSSVVIPHHQAGVEYPHLFPGLPCDGRAWPCATAGCVRVLNRLCELAAWWLRVVDRACDTHNLDHAVQHTGGAAEQQSSRGWGAHAG